jgi:cholesterol transport system auxiliary component
MKFIAVKSINTLGTAHFFLKSACAVLAVSLSACSSLPQAPQAIQSFDFGPSSASKAAAPNTAAIVVLPVEVTEPLASNAMWYRLMYADAQALKPYAQSRWTASPGMLLGQRVREQLAQRFTVLTAGDPGSAQAMQLKIELDEFAQWHSNTNQSSAKLKLRATLFTPVQGKAVATQTLIERDVAAPANASAGAKALAAASDEATAALLQWLPTPAK